MYPYITLLHKFNEQYIIEGCLEKNNFKIIIKKNDLFDSCDILYQFTNVNKKDKIYTLGELFQYKILDDVIVFKISKILFDKMNEESINYY